MSMNRVQISDQNNNLLTLQITLDWVDPSGNWRPDAPGKVRSSSDSGSNPLDLVSSSANSQFKDAICYTLDSTGSRVLVLRLNGYCWDGWPPMKLAKGSGYLYTSGAQAMTAGLLTWINLDKASDSDTASADSNSGSAVATSDGSSGGDGDSASA